MRPRARGWAVAIAAIGTVLIGCAAFWLSFTALSDLAFRSGIAADKAWAWPLLVDGLIVVATVAVVALDGHPAAWYAWTLLGAGALVSVTANALHAVVAAGASVPGVLAAAVAAVPPMVLLASTHLTVVLIRSTRTVPAVQPACVEATVPERTAPAAELLPAPVAPALDADLEPVAEPEGVGRRARADELREAGWSNKRIARELQVHPSTVGRWFSRAYPSDASAPTGAEAVTEGAAS
ncbi:MAG: helix-turn-helix domain-containing protein [Actinobacteria bacterium]|nr:helix-turn-helix domain-containing protein [Actinomycetota bacterium]